jgi:hypothetical protein
MAELAMNHVNIVADEPKEIEAERVDEGKWESEGGRALPSAEEEQGGNVGLIKDVNVTHPRQWPMLVAADSKSSFYGAQLMPSTTLEPPVDATKPLSRKKSITERIAEGFDNLKHKASELLHHHKSEPKQA